MRFNNLYILILGLFSIALMSESTLAQVKELDVNGFKVIFKKSSNDVINAKLFFRGGTENCSKNTEGIEALALNWITAGGTKKTSKESFHNQIEGMASSISSNSTYDYSTITLNCVKSYWDKSWNMFGALIMEPDFDSEEFYRLKEQMIAAAKQNEGDPDNYIRMVSFETAFEGRGYARKTNGSAESLAGLDTSDALRHYKSILTKSQAFLVIAGNITEEDIRNKVSMMFNSLEVGNYRHMPNSAVKLSANKLHTIERDIATNYVRGLTDMPVIGSPDEIPMRLAMSMLNDRFFVEVRTKRNLSYAPAAFYPDLKNGYGGLYASTTDPNQTVQVMTDEIKKIKKEGFTAKELTDKKNKFLTFHYLKLETNSSQTENLGLKEIQGDWKSTERFLNQVSKLTIQQVNTVFNKYLNNIYWNYLGKTEAIDEEVFKLSPSINKGVRRTNAPY